MVALGGCIGLQSLQLLLGGLLLAVEAQPVDVESTFFYIYAHAQGSLWQGDARKGLCVPCGVASRRQELRGGCDGPVVHGDANYRRAGVDGIAQLHLPRGCLVGIVYRVLEPFAVLRLSYIVSAVPGIAWVAVHVHAVVAIGPSVLPRCEVLAAILVGGIVRVPVCAAGGAHVVVCGIYVVACLAADIRQALVAEGAAQEGVDIVRTDGAAADVLCQGPGLAGAPERRGRGAAAVLPLADDVVVAADALHLQEGVDVALLHGPTGPAAKLHCFLVEAHASGRPCVTVLAKLADVDRASVLRSHIGHVLHLAFGVVDAVAMELQHHLGIHLCRGETGVVVAVGVALQDDDVVGINLTNGLDDGPEGVPQQFVAVRERPVRLVDEVVCRHALLVLVALGYLLPQGRQLRAVSLVLPQRGLGGVVVADVAGGLTARAGMHVQDEQDAPAFRPDAHGIDAVEALLQPSLFAGHGFLLDGQGEVLVVHGHAQGVEALPGKELHVLLAEVVVHPEAVELLHLFLAADVGQHLVELELAVQTARGVHHVRLAHHPVAAVRAAHHERLSVAPQ